MAITNDLMQAQFKALLPPGPAFEGNDTSEALYTALTAEPTRIVNRLDVLIAEANPLSTSEMLTEHEFEAGLSGVGVPISTRLNNLLATWTATGGQSIAYFTQMAASLGWAVNITEYTPMISGFAAGSYCYGADWQFAWNVQATLTTPQVFTAGSCAGDPLRSWSNTQLESMFNKFKPAHTVVVFSYV